MKKPERVLSVRVPVDLFRRLRRVAKEHRWTVSQLVRYALDDGLGLFDSKSWEGAKTVAIRSRCSQCKREKPQDERWSFVAYPSEHEHQDGRKRGGELHALICPECRARYVLAHSGGMTITASGNLDSLVVNGVPAIRVWGNGGDLTWRWAG